jgi:hypothetical protein
MKKFQKIKNKWKLIREAHLLELWSSHLGHHFQIFSNARVPDGETILKTGERKTYSFPSVFPHS